MLLHRCLGQLSLRVGQGVIVLGGLADDWLWMLWLLLGRHDVEGEGPVEMGRNRKVKRGGSKYG